MKKYIFLIISLILIPFAVSAWISPAMIGGRGIPGNWLSDEWDKRIKLTIDNTKIDAALSYFPVTVILSSTHGDCVFDELTQGGNRKKIAFTKSDGLTELYGEIEKWDDANESAIIHVSLSGWNISSSADTDFYMYYDVDHADNDTYIGDIDSTPGHSVWDSNFKVVCHMVDETTSAVKDSTSNGNDGTKKAANEPIEATGKVGKGQDFDGANDYVDITASATLNPETGSFTVEAVAKSSGSGTTRDIMDNRENGDGEGWALMFSSMSGTTKFAIEDHNANQLWMEGDTNCFDGSYHYIVGVRDVPVDKLKLYFDGASDATDGTDPTTITVNSTHDLVIGMNIDHTLFPFDDIIDELRISKTNRSAAWIKATYNTLWDTLLTYGSEEVL